MISTLTRLPLISIPLFVAVGVAESGSAGILWAVLCLALSGGVSTLYLEHLRRSVRLGDSTRIANGGRLRPLRLIVAQHFIAWGVVTLLGAPFGLGSLMLAYALLTAVLAALEPSEEISLHAAGVCAAAVALAYAFGEWGLAAALLLPPVWWARTVSGRHTSQEVALGAFSGALAALSCFLLTGG
ncbi:MAG: hypothetical protein L0G70_03930 [Rubrobacter sp.]|nr:hypothetical protein [Rubrobacter sp.]